MTMTLRMTPFRTLLLSIATLAAAVVVLDVSGGSTSESYGIVKSVTRGTRAETLADVRLESGKLVQAVVPTGIRAPEGASVHVRILSRLSGESTYQVIGPGDDRMDDATHR
jgi:hypothetical protein